MHTNWLLEILAGSLNVGGRTGQCLRGCYTNTSYSFKVDIAKLQVLVTLLTIISSLHNCDYLISDLT
jgi:hypothetical protein